MKQRFSSSERLWLSQLLIVALLASVCRILTWDVLLQSWADGGVPVSDARALDMWALNILDGLGFRDLMGFWVYEAFRMPFFSTTVAALYAIFGYAYWPVRIVLASLSVATCLGIAGIGRLLFNRTTGFLAGVFYALYFPMLSYAIAYMTESLFTFLFVLGSYLFLRSIHERGWGFILGSGVAFGLAGMTRFVIFITIPVMAVYLLIESYNTSHSFSHWLKEGWNRQTRLAAIWIIAMMLSFSPWIIRNALVMRAFFPSESGGTRQLWTAANPDYHGTFFSIEAWRKILWENPDMTEIQHNKRLQHETFELIRKNFHWYIDRMAGRARHYLSTPTWHETWQQQDKYQFWQMISTWMAATFGYLGFALALGKRLKSGIFLAGSFFALVALHSLSGEITRYRLTSEWLWVLGVAYTCACLIRLCSHSLLANDEDTTLHIRHSIFDRRLVQWLIPLLLLFPFSVLLIRMPMNYARLRHQEIPQLPASAETIIHDAGLEEQFAQQGGILHDILYYKDIVRRQYTDDHRYAEDVKFPEHVILYQGEASHIVPGSDRRIRSLSFRINKHGTYLGDAVVYYTLKEDVPFVLPNEIKRAQGIVVGTIIGSGTRGEPHILVSDLYVYNEGVWIRCRE